MLGESVIKHESWPRGLRSNPPLPPAVGGLRAHKCDTQVGFAPVMALLLKVPVMSTRRPSVQRSISALTLAASAGAQTSWPLLRGRRPRPARTGTSQITPWKVRPSTSSVAAASSYPEGLHPRWLPADCLLHCAGRRCLQTAHWSRGGPSTAGQAMDGVRRGCIPAARWPCPP